MKHLIGGRVRLALFTLLLLIVSVICLYFNLEQSKNYTEEVNNEPDNDNASNAVRENVFEEPATDAGVQAREQEEEEAVIALPIEVPTSQSKICFTESEVELLAKIAMAEAEGEDIEGKALVICVVLNRVQSTKFPDTIEEVIFQNNGKVYQFSPVKPGGRWWTTEPNEECYKAVAMVQEGWNESNDALYFTSQKGSSWHSRSLTFLFQHGCHKFYN